MERKAFYPGSFDPPTNGHIDIIRRASAIFDKLVIGVVVNPGKNALLELEERVSLLKKLVSDFDNVEVVSFDGLLADYVNENNIDAVVRGLRSGTDYEYENNMAQTNACLYRNGTETVFLLSRPEYSFISSSNVKEVASLGGDIGSFVPELVAEAVYNKYGRK